MESATCWLLKTTMAHEADDTASHVRPNNFLDPNITQKEATMFQQPTERFLTNPRKESPMLQNRTNWFVILGISLFMIVIFNSPAAAQTCGGSQPCECGDRVTSNRNLAAGVDPVLSTVCPDNGLIMDTPNVTLDIGRRNKIVGSGDSIGILITADGVTIKNGGVDNFATGISGTTNDSRIETIRPHLNGVGVALGDEDDGIGDGIFLVGDGNDLIGILAKNNANNGVTVLGNDNLLQGHNDEYNGFHGILVRGNLNHLVANLASENRKSGPGNGITVRGSNNNIERSRVTKMNTNGIVVDGDNNTLSQNQVVKQDQKGIVVDGANNVLTENKATGSKGVGIIVTGTGNPLASVGNLASQNRTNPQCSIYGKTDPNTCIVK
jgi:parallel beta-helix repeat protein